MDFYAIKPYSVFLLDYKDHGHFHVQIFDGNTVEIDYPLRPIQYHKVCGTGRDRKIFSPAEIEKLVAMFFYNAMGDSRLSDRVYIEGKHLQKNAYTQVTFFSIECQFRLLFLLLSSILILYWLGAAQ